MSGRRILVTGGAGYIGSHTCKALALEGYEPIAFDNLSVGWRDAVRWGPFAHGDIRDSDAVAAALKRYGPLAIVHFAASAYVGESVADPGKYYRNNVGGTLSLIEACRLVGVSAIVFSSSCAVYGAPESLPVRETAKIAPVSPYGRTKRFVELILADYAAAYGLKFAALRYFNASGADPDGELAERHDPETHLIPLALMAALGRIPRLEIFGADHGTPDGTCIRDYVHVSDLARAHVAAVRHLLDGGENLTVNLGSGAGASVREVVSTVERVTGRAAPFVVGLRRAGDPPALYADGALARERLGFVPKLSDLDTIVRTAAASFGLRTTS